MMNHRELIRLPNKSVVKLDPRNPWLLVSKQGFDWAQMAASNMCTAIVVFISAVVIL